MKKRFVCLLLAMLMVLTVFAGCGAEESAPVSAEPSEAVSEAAPETAEAPAEETAPETEASVAETSVVEEPVVEDVPYTLPLTTEGATYSLYSSVSPMIGDVSMLDINDNLIFQELEKSTGIHLDIQTVSAFSFTEQFMLMIAHFAGFMMGMQRPITM